MATKKAKKKVAEFPVPPDAESARKNLDAQLQEARNKEWVVRLELARLDHHYSGLDDDDKVLVPTPQGDREIKLGDRRRALNRVLADAVKDVKFFQAQLDALPEPEKPEEAVEEV